MNESCQTICIPVKTLTEWNDLLRADRVDFETHGFSDGDAIAKWATTFTDGSKNLDRIKSVAVYCGSRTPMDHAYAEAAVGLAKFIAAHGMTLVFGASNVGTMKTVADAALAAGREIAYQMLMWVEDLDRDISENLDCSSFDEFDWAELFMLDPLLLGHPQCHKDLHPLDVLYCINNDIRCLQYVDMDKLVPELLPEYATEYTWSRKDADAAREMGAVAFANWLEQYALKPSEDLDSLLKGVP